MKIRNPLKTSVRAGHRYSVVDVAVSLLVCVSVCVSDPCGDPYPSGPYHPASSVGVVPEGGWRGGRGRTFVYLSLWIELIEKSQLAASDPAILRSRDPAIPLAIVQDFQLGVFVMPRHGCLCSVNQS